MRAMQLYKHLEASKPNSYHHNFLHAGPGPSLGGPQPAGPTWNLSRRPSASWSWTPSRGVPQPAGPGPPLGVPQPAGPGLISSRGVPRPLQRSPSPPPLKESLPSSKGVPPLL